MDISPSSSPAQDTYRFTRVSATDGIAEVIFSRGKVNALNEPAVEELRDCFRTLADSCGYRADHWCERGHIVLVLAGTAEIEFRTGRRDHIDAGHVFWMCDGDGQHRIYSNSGAELYIVDKA